jgi:NADPH:quinone reductase-like Zn-dependent oxidoreductase
MTMHAALVTEFGQPPHYATIDPPVPADGEVVVDVLAAGLHPRVRSGAAGKHYASAKLLPAVPGVDGVGLLPDGQRVYFLTLDSKHGSMAEQTLARPARCIPLPAASQNSSADDVTIAAAINPAMSSWVSLRHRAKLQPGQGVLVLGATGIAGRLAIQVARHFGASRVVGLGRDPKRLAALAELGADAALPLTSSAADLTAALTGIDVVVDYLWGTTAQTVLPALLAARTEPNRPLTWLHIGAMAGPEFALPSVALRSHNLIVMGSGQGSVSTADIAAEIPSIMTELVAGTLTIDALPIPLRSVESAWAAPESANQRLVFVI